MNKFKAETALQSTIKLGVMIMFILFCTGLTSATLTDGLISHWNYDGNLVDSIGINNGTNQGTDSIVGKIGNAVNFSGTDNITIINNRTNFTDQPYSLNVWVKTINGEGGIFGSTTSNDFEIKVAGYKLTTGKIGVDEVAGLQVIQQDVWTMLTLTRNSTGYLFYVNGTFDRYLAYASTFTISTRKIGYTAGGGFTGGIDELAIYNRTLSQAEITQLYNSGIGISYPFTISVIQNSPVDMYNSTEKTNIFNTTIISLNSIANVSLYINGTLITTNTSGFNGTYLFSTDLDYAPYSWKVGSCDTTGNCVNSSSRQINVFKIIENVNYYNTPVTSGSNQTFTLNLTYSSTDYSNIGAMLVYNGTSYSATKIGTGDNINLTRSINVPYPTTATNYTFYWNVSLSNGTQYYTNSSTKNQTVQPISIDNCSINSIVLYNFTLADEETQSTINGTLKNSVGDINIQLYNLAGTVIATYSNRFNKTNPFGICFNASLGAGESYLIDTQIQYYADDYSKEYYHIQKDTLTSADFTTNITLYDLSNITATIFKITFRDDSYLPIEDALITIYRKYVSEGVFKIVEIPKTDTKGETLANLVVDEAIYNFVVSKNGENLATFNNVIAVCQNSLYSPCVIDLIQPSGSINTKDFSENEDFVFTLAYNETSRVVSSTFSIPSGNPSNISLFVTRDDAISTSICSDSLTSVSGTLSCTLPASIGNSSIRATLYKDGKFAAWGSVKLDQSASSIFGSVLVLLSVMVLITIVGVGISNNPIITVIFLMIGAIVLFALNLVSNTGFIGAGATILWFLIACILLLIKGARRN